MPVSFLFQEAFRNVEELRRNLCLSLHLNPTARERLAEASANTPGVEQQLNASVGTKATGAQWIDDRCSQGNSALEWNRIITHDRKMCSQSPYQSSSERLF